MSKNRHETIQVSRLILVLALIGICFSFYKNTPVIIHDYLKMKEHRNPLKYIERFYLNTHFNITLPMGKKAVCYRPLQTKVDFGYETPLELEAPTYDDFSSPLSHLKFGMTLKNGMGNVTFYRDSLVWQSKKHGFNILGKAENIPDIEEKQFEK